MDKLILSDWKDEVSQSLINKTDKYKSLSDNLKMKADLLMAENNKLASTDIPDSFSPEDYKPCR